MKPIILKNHVRLKIRGVLNPLLVSWCNRNKKYKSKDARIIFGHPRSGTTWLAEILTAIPRSAILFEPLSPQEVSEACDAGYGSQNLWKVGERRPKERAFMQDILEGRIINKWTTSHIPLTNTCGIDVWIVKVINANQMIEWFVDGFDLPAPLFIVRHPCAVLASRLRRGWKIPSSLGHINDNFKERYPEYAEVIASLHTPEEIFAARWCMDHVVPFSMPAPYPYQLVSYEKLLMDGASHIEPIFKLWKQEIPETLQERLQNPSMKVGDSFSENKRKMLFHWKNVLTKEQEGMVLNVVRGFGIEFFSEDPEPDYAKMFSGKSLLKR